jgi:hypothetical protein
MGIREALAGQIVAEIKVQGMESPEVPDLKNGEPEPTEETKNMKS